MKILKRYLDAKKDAEHGALWTTFWIGLFIFICYKAWMGMSFLWGWLPFSAWFFLIIPPLPFWIGFIYVGIQNIMKYYSEIGGIPLFNHYSKLFKEVFSLLENDQETQIQEEHIELQTSNNKIVIEDGYIILLERIETATSSKTKKSQKKWDSDWVEKERYEMNGAENKKIVKIHKKTEWKNKGDDRKNVFLKSVMEIKEERLKKQMQDYENVLKDIEIFQQESKNKTIENMEKIRQLQA